ncbi:MAG TPA: hypothetical protein VL053_13100 [Arachidicoccus sp.]|nr:hypothetical protein [Arachidicoccus sp.]
MKPAIKYISIFLILFGIIALYTTKSSDAELPLLIGLFTLFISREKREDERSVAVKASSALYALIIAYSLKLIISNLYQHQVIPFDLSSINYFLIVVFSLANIIRFSKLYFFMA